METLADRAHRLVAHHVRPALPFPAVVELLRQEGCPVTDAVLLGALRREPDRFRLLDPWRGTLAALAALGVEAALEGIVPCGGRGVHDAGDRAEGSRAPDHGPCAGLLVIALGPPLSRSVTDRARWAVVLLGRELDEASVRDRSRWLRLLCEAVRLPAVA